MKWTSVFFLTCISLCATLSTDRAAAADRWFGEGDSLFGTARFFEAAVAYERSYFLSEDAQQRVLVNLAKAEALKQMGEFSRARNDLQRSLTFYGNDSLRKEVNYQVALCAYLDGDASGARSLLMRLRRTFEEVPSSRQFLLEGLVLVDLAEWDDLRGHLMEWFREHADGPAEKERLLQAYDALLNKWGGPPEMLDPGRARMWSTFVPGSGQVYAGSAGWGVLNAFSQVLALGGFGLLVYNGTYIASVVAGLGPFQSFYFGGIRQAGTLAGEKNKSRLEGFRAALGEFLLDVAVQMNE